MITETYFETELQIILDPSIELSVLPNLTEWLGQIWRSFSLQQPAGGANHPTFPLLLLLAGTHHHLLLLLVLHTDRALGWMEAGR